MGKPEPTFSMDEIEAMLAALPTRDPELEGFTSTELADAIEQDTGERHSQKWVMVHYVRPLRRAGRIRPKMIARLPECALNWTHLLGYVFTQEEEEA